MKLTIDLSELGNTELRLLANYLRVRAGVCIDAGSREEMPLREAVEDISAELAKRQNLELTNR